MPDFRDFAAVYLKNRTDFYAALLPRVPHAGLRQLLSVAADQIEADQATVSALNAIPAGLHDDFTSDFGLRDLLKKSSFGAAWGRTTISIEEALARSEIVEETGFVLFKRLAELHPSSAIILKGIASQRESSLAAILRLTDDLRYHKIAP